MEFAKNLASLITEDEPEQPRQEVPAPKSDALTAILNAAKPFQTTAEPEPEENDRHSQALQAAMEQLVESEGFIIIGVERRPHPQVKGGMLEPYAFGFSETPEAELAIQIHMAGVSARSHQDLAVKALAEVTGNES